MFELLTAPLRYDFMLRGLGAGILAAIACAALSCFVVWRGWAFIGDALAHTMLPGIVLAQASGIGLIFGALIASIFSVLGIGAIKNKSNLREDSAIGIIFAGFFALGILLLSTLSGLQDLSHILFGNILGVSNDDLVLLAIVTAIILIVLKLGFKELLTASFDPAHASAIGLSPGFIRYLLLVLLALTTVVAVQAVGVVLVVALLVTPAASASLLTRKLETTIALSFVFALTATIIGFYISYYTDLTSGPVIVLTLISFFCVSMAVSHFRQSR